MKIINSLVLTGVSVLSLTAATAHAQASADQASVVEDRYQSGDLAPTNEIIVSARRRAESVQDVPQTVNVVTAEQVDKLNLRSFTDIQNVVPGLQLQSSSAFSNQATVRGIAFAPEASGNNPSVEFYLNDAPISSAFLFQTTFDFGQLELQRGPQGTLRGRASPSGAIAVTTRRPDLTEIGGYINGTYSSIDARKLEGALNLPLVPDVLAVRLAGVVDRNDASRVRTVAEDLYPDLVDGGAYRRSEGWRGSVRFEPVNWASLDVMYQRLHSKGHRFEQVISESLINPAAPASTAPLIGAFDRRAIDEQGSYDRQDQEVFIVNGEVRFAGQKLNYVGSWNDQDNGIIASQDNANFFSSPRVNVVRRSAGDPTGFDPVCQNEVKSQFATFTTGAYNQCTHSMSERRSHELRLSSDERIGGIFDYVIGGFYDHNENPSNLTVETPVLLNPNAVPANVLTVARVAILRRGEATEKSVFGNLTAHLLDDRLEISGGLRYIDYKSDSLPTLQSSATGSVTCAEYANLRCNALGVGVEEDENATIYTGSISYRVTPDIMVYALTGSSWRPGPRVVGNFSTVQSEREQSFLNLPPERSKSYEVGVKTSFHGGRGRFNLSAFYQDFENYPFRGPPIFYISTNESNGVAARSVATFNFVSPVPVEVKGVEAEASYQIMDRWSLGLNASYADGRIKNGTIACNDLNGDGIPDLSPGTPTLAQLQAAVGPGQTISQCSGIDRRATQAPKFSANVQSEYAFDVSGNTDGFVRGLYSFFGKTQNDPDNTLDNVDAYGLLNLYAGIRDKNGAWELAFFGKNVTREREILSVGNTLVTTTVRSITSAGAVTSPYRQINVTAPREFGVNLRVAFGSR
ncbi:TonB-dependent receptor [Novosphingobium sp. M1R2S20]|uniref:TonB-dependent receptor n=1 Tax=Novosphingobium rhizovicinum TaxID=3228928 RepID=A0ABV3RE75_9SPHN